MSRDERLTRMENEELEEIYRLVDEVRADEIKYARAGTKASLTRMRTRLSRVSNLCKTVRKELLAIRDGRKTDEQVRSGRGGEAEEGEDSVS